MTHPVNANGLFNVPVDPVAQNLPQYHLKVPKPLYLGTIKNRLSQPGVYYGSVAECVEDIRLVFRNAITFNGEQHVVGKAAKELLREMESELCVIEERVQKEVSVCACVCATMCMMHVCVMCMNLCAEGSDCG